MIANKGYNVYAQNKILTATPAELTLLLYEGAIKFSNIALEGMQEKNVEKAHKNILKVEAILDEFLVTLDHKYPVAKDFENVYVYLQKCLLQANLKKDEAIMREVLKHLRTMRDTWKQVMQQNKLAKAN